MFNQHRIWNVGDVANAETLAELLSKRTWTLCTGFRLGGYLFLNDSISEDGAGEYAIVEEKSLDQVESVTFGWLTYDKALTCINEAVAGKYTSRYGHISRDQLAHPEWCRLCA